MNSSINRKFSNHLTSDAGSAVVVSSDRQHTIAKLLLYLTICLVTITSCKKDWLNAKTIQNLAVPSTLKDFQALMDDNNTMNLQSPALQEMASDGHYVAGTIFSSLNDFELNAYTWSNIMSYSDVYDWSYAYQRVFNSNLVLEGLVKIQPTNSIDQQTWNNLKGDALFHRAMSFYELAQIWAPVYDSSTSKSDLSIPLRLSSDANLPQVRSTVQDTYDQIINDLLVAKNLLSVTPAYKTRASKPAVFALLARLYLSKRDYINARLNADSCLQLYNILLNYNSFTIPATYPFAIFNNEVIFHESMLYYSSIASSYAMIDSSLYASYTDNDLRKQLFFKASSGNTVYFNGMYDNTTGQLFDGLAVDEVYLIRAECSARSGNTNTAMADLNTLLQTRWKNTVPFPTYTATDANDALNQILTERKKELIFRGLRWTDLRRLNKEKRFATTLTRAYNGAIYTLTPNSYQYTFPIPIDILKLSGIPQNPGW